MHPLYIACVSLEIPCAFTLKSTINKILCILAMLFHMPFLLTPASTNLFLWFVIKVIL